MSKTERIRQAFERNRKAVELRPSIAHSTSRVTCRTIDGVTCEVTDGTTKMITDEPEADGGDDLGPTPGFFIRAGLASCCAMCYVTCAARLAVPIDSIEVEVESDADAHGVLGLADVPSGFTAVRYLVTVHSSAPEADILKVIEAGDNMSPMLEVVRDPVPVKREVRIERSKAA